MEGAQGTLLDPDFGTYPYVTSSSPIAANSALGTGISIHEIDHIAGVFKAYSTRVGGGPMPTELHDETGELIRNQAQEYGATTGRPRRCGWFDAVAGRFSARINGFDSIVMTRLDILDSLPSIKICTAYRVGGAQLSYFPTSSNILSQCEPVYEELPGWQTPTNHIADFDMLPPKAKQYIRRIEGLLEGPASIISVGASRNQTITVSNIWKS
jgi:adenylosuccinate synthase